MIAFTLLMILAFTIPWEKSVIVPGFGTLTKVIGVGAALAAIPDLRRLRPNLVMIFGALFVAWSGLTWFWSLDPTATAARAATFAQLLVLFAITVASCTTHARTRLVMLAYVVGAAVASVMAMLRYSQGLQTYWRRYAAPGFDPNDFGLTIALAIPMALYLGGIWRAFIVVFSAAILLTGSRTAFIASFLGLTFVLLTWRSSTILQRAAGLGFATLLVLGAVFVAPERARERIASTPAEITRGTLHQRTTIWKAGLRAFRWHPVVGAGSGAYPDAVEPLIGVPGRLGHEYVAHNVFLSVLVETGIIGFALWGLLVGSIAVFIWALKTRERALWTAAALVWLAAAATLTWEHRKPTWLAPALITAMWSRSFRAEDSG